LADLSFLRVGEGLEVAGRRRIRSSWKAGFGGSRSREGPQFVYLSFSRGNAGRRASTDRLRLGSVEVFAGSDGS
jgi:hypothetical protein